MSVEALVCPKCGGKISLSEEVCKYCGTYYVVKGEKVLDLSDLVASDENLERYIRLVNLRLNHFTERMDKWRLLSEEEIRDLAHQSRTDLKEELLREPTIGEVAARFHTYLSSEYQRRAARYVPASIKIFLLLSIGLLIIMLLLWYLMTR